MKITDTEATSIADSALYRYNSMPMETREEIDRLTELLRKYCSGPETTESFDAIINAMLEPFGIAQRTVWDAETRFLKIETSTLEALRGSST